MIKVEPFDGKLKTILDLAQSYYNSYVTLSKEYKSDKEMALYKKGTFIKKLKKISQDNSSHTFIYFDDDKPLGFARYSPVPSYYHKDRIENAEIESGTTPNGYDYYWKRKLDLNAENNMDDKTIMLNQIYLDPSIQKKGLGTKIIDQTLPKIKEAGFESLVIEYNSNNENARRFYRNTLALREIGTTRDFDNVVSNPTEICMSPVTLGFVEIDKAINKINSIKMTNKVVNSNAK
ncbi:MAG: GNAT family N-acetyltransferase [Alphaproteobacteria bacterium]